MGESILICVDITFRQYLLKNQFNAFTHFHTHWFDDFRTSLVYIYIGIYKIKCSGFNFRKIENVRYQLQKKFIILLHDFDIFLPFASAVRFS